MVTKKEYESLEALKGVTTKAVYKSRISSILTPLKLELKYPLTNFQETVYPRLEVKQRDILFSLFHGIYRNRERIHQQGRATLPEPSRQERKAGPRFGAHLLHLLQGEGSLELDKEESFGFLDRSR